jgi:Phosphotransferase enzyme family
MRRASLSERERQNIVPSQPQIETDLQRVILFASNGAEVLVRHDGGRLDLPAVPVPRHQRVAENLTAFMRREWSQDAVSLFALIPSSAECERRYQVAESTAARRSSITGFRWVSVSSLDERQFEEPDDCGAIARSLTQCEEYAAGRNRGPFGQLGWFAELSEWVGDRIRPAGFVLSGRFTQLNASPTFSLIRFETNGPAMWFKAVGEPNLREYAISRMLSSRFPAYVCRLIATHEEWNAWLTIEAEGSHPAESSNLDTWLTIVQSLAELQIASVGQTLHLLDSYCRDARLSSLLDVTPAFFDLMNDLMTQQISTSPALLSRNDLTDLQIEIRAAIAEAENSEIPNTIGHFDFSPGNIVVHNKRCLFLDWAEGYAGHPFHTFQYLLRHAHRTCAYPATWIPLMTETYLRCWRAISSPQEIAKALQVEPLLAAFAYAVCGNAWQDATNRSSPETGRHLRSLTRHMKREADALRSGRAACPD